MLTPNERRRSQSGRRRRGFTLVEMVMVVLFLGIVSAVAVPRFAVALQKYGVTNAANRIVADLARAQSGAYSSSAPMTVTFTVPASQYQLAGIKSLDHPSGTYTVDLTQYPFKSRLVSVWGQTSAQTITFNGFGLPDKGGNIVVAAGSQQKTIVVDTSTGVAVIQ